MLKLGAAFYLLVPTPHVYHRLCMGLKSSLLTYSTIWLFRGIEYVFIFLNHTPACGSELPEGSLQAYKATRSENQHSDCQEGWGHTEWIQSSYLSCLMVFLFVISNASLPQCCDSPCISSDVSCPRWFTRKRCWITSSQDSLETENGRMWGGVSLNA